MDTGSITEHPEASKLAWCLVNVMAYFFMSNGLYMKEDSGFGCRRGGMATFIGVWIPVAALCIPMKNRPLSATESPRSGEYTLVLDIIQSDLLIDF